MLLCSKIVKVNTQFRRATDGGRMWSTGQALPLTALDSLYNAHQTSQWLTTRILWR